MGAADTVGERWRRAAVRALASGGVAGLTPASLARESGGEPPPSPAAGWLAVAAEELVARWSEAVVVGSVGSFDRAEAVDGVLSALAGTGDTESEAAWCAVDAAGAVERARASLRAVVARFVGGDEVLAARLVACAEQAWAGRPEVVAPVRAELGARRVPGREERVLRSWAPVPLSEEVWAAWRAAMASPGRVYHTVNHVLEVALAWRALGRQAAWGDPRSTFLAVLFHDAVYDLGRPDNEARSADLLTSLVRDAGGAEALILATAGHADPGLGEDGRRFLDCDLAILGARPARYRRYMAQVREEWAPIASGSVFDLGRGRFLASMWERPTIFLSAEGRRRWEEAARANLAWERAAA